MSFSADWLALRADADRRARDAGLAARLSAHFGGRRLAGSGGVRVVDLGSGTGATLGTVAPLLGPGQSWRLVDADRALLERATPPEGVAVERVTADLAGTLGPLLDPRPDLVTASAFFDLCGAAWIDRLVRHVAVAGAALYAALSYDGREAWAPPHPRDAAVLAAFHADQRRDKGLGPALGPHAAAYLAAKLRAAGFQVLTAPSDWRLAPPGDAALIAALARGSAAAVAPALGRAAAADWERGRSQAASVSIGHTDVLALPPRIG